MIVMHGNVDVKVAEFEANIRIKIHFFSIWEGKIIIKYHQLY